MTFDMTTLALFKPDSSELNTGMVGAIGRATIFNPDMQPELASRFMTPNLTQGNATLAGVFQELTPGDFNPKSPAGTVYTGERPAFINSVAKTPWKRQLKFELNDEYVAEHCQTPEMVGDVIAAQMAGIAVEKNRDMYAKTVSEISTLGDTGKLKDGQIVTLTAGVGDAGFGEQLNNAIADTLGNKFHFVSNRYNSYGKDGGESYRTKTDDAVLILKKEIDYPGFQKLYSETYNPEYIKAKDESKIEWVDSFDAPATVPKDTELVGIILDKRALAINPLGSGFSIESQRLIDRQATAYFGTYKYLFEYRNYFNHRAIFAPKK